MTGAPLRLEGVWKAYPRWPAGGRTLRAVLSRRVPLVARRGEQRWALREVSLELAPGRSLGLIGRNGAGKSTLLRLAAGLGRPTRGRVHVPAGAASVLTLGDTLDATLTGRENAYTAAIVAGWSRAGARALVPGVLAFAELEEFADAPVRTYSEGMKLRLAFGVVAQLQPDALLLDEVMAVGDLAFQAKCMARVREMREAGTSLLLASHDLRLVERECDQALWLEGGRVAAAGEAAAVVSEYEAAARARTLSQTPSGPPAGQQDGLELRRNRVGTQEATVESVELRGPSGKAGLAAGEPLELRLVLRAQRGSVLDPILQVTIHREHDDALCLEVNTQGQASLGRLGETRLALTLDRLDLVPGRYFVDVGLYRADWEVVYDFHWHAYALDVAGPGSDRGVLRPPHRWTLES